ncbi:TadE/TadG family type IV pilus assembly protein [Pseudoalteromonas denitrificans]|uniref:Putative Flp pilus-assembly TadE/G-like n=1 Tax=Pseudoalteromonas denitrificans DSM 6059 TaxID=1123010 RepID=A0A1I1LZ77_9GAMM|nr:pilus assembly protein TadG-related protein [Pseudoalteromonas denitrificans]SFC74770.1 Putative Flp pilus-assembly TadE/G-like [Pseudoalteromonas denitrificans DSM 6059]
MKLARQTYPKIKRQQGISVIAALFVIPVLLLIGGIGVTLSNTLAAQTHLGNASEAAAMYIAKRNLDNNTENLSAATAFINQYSGLADVNDVSISKEVNGYRVKSRFDTAYILLPGNNSNVIKVANQGAAGTGKQLQFDIALVIDLSGSQKSSIETLKNTLSNIIEQLDQRFESGNIRIALVPFSFLVSVEDANWLPESHNRLQCVDAISFKSSINGELVSSADKTAEDVFTHYQDLLHIRYQPRPEDTTWIEEGCPDIATLPLSEDLSKVSKRIQEHIEPSNVGMTIYYHSIIMGARMLSEQWAGEWNNNTQYRAKANKAIIVFGDGKGGGSYSYDFKAMIEQGICENIRNEGIEIYGIEYGDFANNSNIESCIGSDKMSPLNNLSTLIDLMLEQAGIDTNNQKLQLIR